MRAADLDFSEALVAKGNLSFESGAACAEQLLAEEPPPTAIFASNDDMAAGVIQAAKRQGIDIPGQLSVAGFDDIPLARQLDPPLTTIRQPLVRMTEKAAAMLGQCNGKDSETKQAEVVPATIKIRATDDDEAWVKDLFVPQVRRAGDLCTVAALAAPRSPCCLFATPLEGGWISVPGAGDSFKPGDDLARFGRMLSC